MKQAFVTGAVAVTLVAASFAVQAGPAEDLAAFQAHYKKQFPDINQADFKDGAYALDPTLKAQWEEMESSFPPYEPDIDAGKKIWETPFKNGKTYADCMGDVKSVRGKYPYYDAEKNTVVTMVGALDACKKTNDGEGFVNKEGKPFLNKGAVAQLSAYVAMEGRGGKINLATPEGKGLEWYEKGKNFFYAKRGQLNMSCADCHVYNAGKMIRADLLSPAMGHVTHWPTYRSADGEITTLHNRFMGCNTMVRANNFKAEGDEYKALEYFMTYMSNGQEWNGPGSRK
ncbi:MAG TPA: sulfur oxidation c-type cytochrome SoxA [Candidatus Thiothrix moscowensis]|uniref:sulfur oxidation c-type cytochrome SoxA n=1 Tax=unclassified Thiothrix TaxID=2636184 RepID=UPI001A196017|nr:MULTISPECIES: sulfur oxidation c-type cytochrome SoxA [unclassified Thiothrix]MBJ6612060.1 sulfur oxidation c-type cytochrome SoxA [Candidatus Thiothrix moscowensis]HRJ52775.1 sulfur oxidation c-type cytochrome SoxA [Candidatus Thiothrix moscowensis]HRJ92741.1 sulfur oxidation c-type cytochrome SoxA [Candidatus Thiothrix moscowensis]